MSNINNITSKIISDAEAKKEALISEANEKRNSTISKKQEEAEVEKNVILERAKRESAARKDRIISGAELNARNEKLAAKQKVIKDVFENSVDALCDLSDKEFKEFVVNAILNANIEGTQNLILNDAGKEVIDDAVISEINSKLDTAEVVLSNEKGMFKGGFILEKDGIEINNTFEALVSSIKDDLSLEVAQVLFN